MKLRAIRIGISQSLPQNDEDSGLTYSNRPTFEAEVEIEEGDDGDEAADQLYQWVLWHYKAAALATHTQHRRLLTRGIFGTLKRFLTKNPKPPRLG